MYLPLNCQITTAGDSITNVTHSKLKTHLEERQNKVIFRKEDK